MSETTTPIDESTANETAQLEAEIADLERRIPAALKEYETKGDRAHKTGLRLLAADDSGSVPAKLALQSEKEDTEADRARATYESLLSRVQTKKRQLEQLRDPREIEKRVSQRLRLNNLKETNMAKKETAKDQGFPSEYLGDSGNFRPGMDARAKSDLVNAYLGLEAKDALVQFTKAQAEKLLKARGWMSFVAKRQAAVEAAAARAEKAKEKAAAKKEADAKAKDQPTPPAEGDGDQTLAEAAAADGDPVDEVAAKRQARRSEEVKGDPKPTPAAKKRGGRVRGSSKS